MSWKALVLVAAGFLGGVCSAIGGSGIDIASFATLTLLFRVSEKVRGTTTSYGLKVQPSHQSIHLKHCLS